MSARLIDGKKIAEEIENELKAKVSKMDTPPKLSVIQVGDDPASTSYIKAKSNAAKRVGIELTHHHLSTDTTESDLCSLIRRLNSSEDGIIVQLPLPKGLESALNEIEPENDVDGFHPANLGRLVQGKSGMKPCTPAGIVNLSGKFDKGDHIKILDTKNKEFARGLSSFSSEEINKIMGCQSNEIEKKLGYITRSEVVHKDDMVEV